jgi:hypothetical protein
MCVCVRVTSIVETKELMIMYILHLHSMLFFEHIQIYLFIFNSKTLSVIQTVILPLVLYWCKTWFLIPKEKHRLRVFENRVLRKIFGPKKDELTGEWNRLYTEVLHILFYLPHIIRLIESRRIRWAGHVARMGERRCLVLPM